MKIGVFIIFDNIDETVKAIDLEAPETRYAITTFRGRRALCVPFHHKLCSAAPDTMLRNCFLHKYHARVSEAAASVICALNAVLRNKWMKGDDLGAKASAILGSQVNILVGPAVGHDLGFSKCLSGMTAELEKSLRDGHTMCGAWNRTIGAMQTRSPQGDALIPVDKTSGHVIPYTPNPTTICLRAPHTKKLFQTRA